MDLFDVAAVERAEKSINEFINSRSKSKEKANAEADLWRISEGRHRERRRGENREAWAEHYEAMYRTHARLASEHAARAMALRTVGEGDHMT